MPGWGVSLMRAELSRACCGVVGGCGCALPVAHLAVRGSAAALRAGRPAAPLVRGVSRGAARALRLTPDRGSFAGRPCVLRESGRTESPQQPGPSPLTP